MKNVSNQTVVGPIDFYSICFPILCQSMGSINLLVNNIVENIFFCAQKRKETHLEQLMGE